MIRKKVIYGHSVPYRNMCRYNSGVSFVVSRGICRRREKAENVWVGFGSSSLGILFWPIMIITGG